MNSTYADRRSLHSGSETTLMVEADSISALISRRRRWCLQRNALLSSLAGLGTIVGRLLHPTHFRAKSAQKESSATDDRVQTWPAAKRTKRNDKGGLSGDDDDLAASETGLAVKAENVLVKRG